MEIKNNNMASGGIELPPLTPIDTTKSAQPTQPVQSVEQNSLLQQAITQKQEIDEDMKNKLKEIRYRVYIFAMLLAGLLSFPYFNKVSAQHEALKTQITDSNAKTEQAIQDLNKANQNIKLIKDVKAISVGSGINGLSASELDTVKRCYFQNEGDTSKCKDLSGGKVGYITSNANILRNIALLRGNPKSTLASGSISNFDQKKVLQGLNEEIIGSDVMKDASLTSFGEKTLIKFSDDSNEKTKLYKVPITITANLTYKQLTNILKNIEKMVIYKNNDLSNLYDVKTVTYDIGKYDDKQGQDTTLNIDTYFYEN